MFVKHILMAVVFLSALGLKVNAYAQDCNLQFDKYGSGNGPSNIEANCFEEIYNNASTPQSGDENQFLILSKKMVFISEAPLENFWSENKNKQNRFISSKSMIFSGANFSKYKIKSAAANSKDKELIIYDEEKNVFAFFPLIGGNLSPYRVLKPAKVTNLNSMAYDTHNNLLWIANATGELQAYPTYNYYRNPSNVAGTAPQKIISGPLTKLSSPQQMTYNSNDQELAVYDQATMKILVFSNNDDGNRAPAMELSHPELNTAIKSIIFVSEKNQYWVRLMNDKILKLDRK